MPFDISRSDMITFFDKDAIVIPSHTDLKKCPGVSEEVFKRAGSIKLSLACRKGKNLSLGDAFVTDGLKSRFKHIIHVACLPSEGEKIIPDDILHKSYISALTAAEQNDVQTLSIPLLDSSVDRSPRSFEIACSTIREFIKGKDIDVELYIGRDVRIPEPEAYDELNEFVQKNLKPAKPTIKFSLSRKDPLSDEDLAEIERRFQEKRDYFADYLIKLIDSRKLSNVDVYTRANISRQQFSRIISKRDYMPQKKTIYAFAVALKLSKDETEELLKKAGYAFSDTDKMDVIMSYFIEKGKYDIFEINDALFYYGQSLLGSGM